MMIFQRFNIRFKRYIIESSDKVSRILGILSAIIALTTLGSLFYYHGFYIPQKHENIILLFTLGSLIFFALKYLFLWFYADNKKQYLRKHLVEGIFLAGFIVNFFVLLWWNSEIVFDHASFQDHHIHYHILFLQLYFLIVSVLELVQSDEFLSKISITPAALMLISFLILIGVGAVLLMMPRMTHEGISFVDALFTSTSASCVTGLTVLNTGSDFTFRGQFVIMLLMQLGGISILAFATFFAAFFASSRMGVKQQHLLKDFFSTSTITDSISMLREIVLATVLIEATGVILLYFHWKSIGLFADNSENLFYSFFHAISAFTNAGFCLWDENFMHEALRNNYFSQTVIMGLIVTGGLGFIFLHDAFSLKQIKQRHIHKWKRLSPSSKIVLSTTYFIIIIGAVIFYFLERHASLENLGGWIESAFASLFQIVTSRSAGFNTLDMRMISAPALLLIMLVMFIGASPGSTGGGIKTTTAFVIFKSVVATIRGKNSIEYQKKTIPFEIVDKSYSIVIMSMLIILISVFALAIVEPDLSFLTLVFESISAFSICGLSMGCTSELSEAGKIILITNMYIGRIGTLSIAFALTRRIKQAQHQYPNTYFMVG